MQKAKVLQLFRMLAMLDDVKPWQDIAEAAMQSVQQQLKPDADPEDIRLCFYAAALANLQYRRMIAAEAVSPTYAGTVAGERCDTAKCTLAERLVLAYRSDAAALLRDDAFVFQAV